MAWLEAAASFNPDAFAAPVIGIAAVLGNHDSGLHRHQRGQLLFTQQGCTRITLDNQLCLLPPTRAAWIPGGLPHRAVMQQAVDYRSVYVSAALAEQLPAQVRVIEVLATGRSLGYCAFELGFASDSALIAFFKGMTGTTPRGYFKSG